MWGTSLTESASFLTRLSDYAVHRSKITLDPVVTALPRKLSLCLPAGLSVRGRTNPIIARMVAYVRHGHGEDFWGPALCIRLLALLLLKSPSLIDSGLRRPLSCWYPIASRTTARPSNGQGEPVGHRRHHRADEKPISGRAEDQS